MVLLQLLRGGSVTVFSSFTLAALERLTNMRITQVSINDMLLGNIENQDMFLRAEMESVKEFGGARTVLCFEDAGGKPSMG